MKVQFTPSLEPRISSLSLPEATHTLLDDLQQHATRTPDRGALILLDDKGNSLEQVTYGRLYAEVQALAAQLRPYHGQSALLLYPSGLPFVKAILACFYAGVLAVPAPLPTQYSRSRQRIKSVLDDAQARLILSETQELPLLEGWLSSLDRSEVSVMASDDVFPTDSLEPAEPTPLPLAFLQYTSGSTGTPRGVIVPHQALLHNFEDIRVRFGMTPSSIMCSWLPMFHDMGLIGCLLFPLWMGMLNVLMKPMIFLKRPSVWLQAISRYRATVAGGPNFAYDHCVQRVRDSELHGLDLSSWQVAFNGSEPVHSRTLETFASRFVPYRLRPEALYACYGLAESTLLVTGGAKLAGITTLKVNVDLLERGLIEQDFTESGRTLVSSGRTHHLTVSVVDPESQAVLQEDRVGEIWVQGPSVAAGYWNQAEQSAATFEAFTADGQGPFLKTGDLGFLHGGELYITGRLKDLIIQGGRNLYPQDLEQAALESDPGIRSVAAFSVPTEQHEAVVLVLELGQRVHDQAAFDTLVRTVRSRISSEFAVRVEAVVGVAADGFLRTTSRKVMRSEMRRLFLSRRLTSTFETVSDALEGVRQAAPLELPEGEVR